MFLIEVMQFSI